MSGSDDAPTRVSFTFVSSSVDWQMKVDDARCKLKSVGRYGLPAQATRLRPFHARATVGPSHRPGELVGDPFMNRIVVPVPDLVSVQAVELLVAHHPPRPIRQSAPHEPAGLAHIEPQRWLFSQHQS